jgi:hypothetical protein
MSQRVVPILKRGAYDNLFGALKSGHGRLMRLDSTILSYMNMHTPDELLSLDNAVIDNLAGRSSRKYVPDNPFQHKHNNPYHNIGSATIADTVGNRAFD